jgi:hypothetical protein
VRDVWRLRARPHLRRGAGGAGGALVCSADLSALRKRAADLERRGCTILAKPFDVDEVRVLLQQLARSVAYLN